MADPGVMRIRLEAIHLECSLCGATARIDIDAPIADRPLTLWWAAHRGPTIKAIDLQVNGQRQHHPVRSSP